MKSSISFFLRRLSNFFHHSEATLNLFNAVFAFREGNEIKRQLKADRANFLLRSGKISAGSSGHREGVGRDSVFADSF
jgi:hypothetical protein